MELLPDWATMTERIAWVYEHKLSRLDMARMHLVELHLKAPDDLDVLRHLVHLETGATRRKYQWLLVSRLPAKHPERIELLRFLGREGYTEVARRAWCSIIDILPDDPEAMLNIQKLGLPADDVSLYKVMGDRPETLNGFSAAHLFLTPLMKHLLLSRILLERTGMSEDLILTTPLNSSRRHDEVAS